MHAAHTARFALGDWMDCFKHCAETEVLVSPISAFRQFNLILRKFFSYRYNSCGSKLNVTLMCLCERNEKCSVQKLEHCEAKEGHRCSQSLIEIITFLSLLRDMPKWNSRLEAWALQVFKAFCSREVPLWKQQINLRPSYHASIVVGL